MSSDAKPDEVIHLEPYKISQGISASERNHPCHCGSFRKAKKCCFTGKKISAAKVELDKAWKEELQARKEIRTKEAEQALAEGRKPPFRNNTAIAFILSSAMASSGMTLRSRL